MIPSPTTQTMMQYVEEHVQHCACKCDECQRSPKPGHTVDVIFFRVSLFNSPSRAVFEGLIDACKPTHLRIAPLEGHALSWKWDALASNWLGGRDSALNFIALGKLLGMWKVRTPMDMPTMPAHCWHETANMGFIEMIVPPAPSEV